MRQLPSAQLFKTTASQTYIHHISTPNINIWMNEGKPPRLIASITSPPTKAHNVQRPEQTSRSRLRFTGAGCCSSCSSPTETETRHKATLEGRGGGVHWNCCRNDVVQLTGKKITFSPRSSQRWTGDRTQTCAPQPPGYQMSIIRRPE